MLQRDFKDLGKWRDITCSWLRFITAKLHSRLIYGINKL